MKKELERRYIVKRIGKEQYISTLTLPPKSSEVCESRDDAYKFHDKEWLKEKLSFYRDFDLYEIVEI